MYKYKYKYKYKHKHKYPNKTHSTALIDPPPFQLCFLNGRWVKLHWNTDISLHNVLSDSFEYDFHSEPSGLTFISEKSEINDDFGKIRPCLVAGGAQ